MHLFSALSPYEQTKYEGTVPQQSSWDCGPAAAATVLELAGITPSPWPENTPNQTISLALLADYFHDHGLEAVGYKVNWEQLQYFFENFPNRPLLAHRSSDEGHFVVLLGFAGKYPVLADPSAGLRVLAPSLFRKDFQGYILHFPQLPELNRVQELLFLGGQRLNLLQNTINF
ncbi:MAG: hypothetical protein GX335_02460 [Firmicutes bacterium]|nr:hypothetical protein [Bacillota bacterium]